MLHFSLIFHVDNMKLQHIFWIYILTGCLMYLHIQQTWIGSIREEYTVPSRGWISRW